MSAQATEEEVAALVAFAGRNGRSWKEKLWTIWGNGRDYYEPEGQVLHQIRNNYGPSWLHDFKLPKV
jgi:hypothetical protein